MSQSTNKSVALFESLLDSVEGSDKPGQYLSDTQTWSERSQAKLSPVKHHQEM
jgi:hypothetical protein